MKWLIEDSKGKIMALFLAVFLISCSKPKVQKELPAVPSAEIIKKQCRDYIGEPRVEQISEHVWVATAYDLANTVLIHTKAGNVIIDASMSPARAREAREALKKNAPDGPVKAIIYTHSHIDHIGGTSEWVEEALKYGRRKLSSSIFSNSTEYSSPLKPLAAYANSANTSHTQICPVQQSGGDPIQKEPWKAECGCRQTLSPDSKLLISAA